MKVVHLKSEYYSSINNTEDIYWSYEETLKDHENMFKYFECMNRTEVFGLKQRWQYWRHFNLILLWIYLAVIICKRNLKQFVMDQEKTGHEWRSTPENNIIIIYLNTLDFTCEILVQLYFINSISLCLLYVRYNYTFNVCIWSLDVDLWQQSNRDSIIKWTI